MFLIINFVRSLQVEFSIAKKNDQFHIENVYKFKLIVKNYFYLDKPMTY